jgi:hypothetical protein
MQLPKLSSLKPKVKLWKIVAGASVVIPVVLGLWKIDDRYAKEKDLVKTEKNIEEKSVRTFEKFQMKQETITSGLRLDILNIEYDRVMKELKKLRRALKKNPDDIDIEVEIEELKENIKDINNKRKTLMDRLTGVE